MNRAWILVLSSLLFLGASAWAQATVTVTNGPYALNPATSDVAVDYSLIDPANSGPAYIFYYYLSVDATLETATDELVDTADGLVWVSECDNGDVTISPGMSCTHNLSLGSRPDGVNYLFVDARYLDSGSVEQPLDVSDAVQTTFDSTPPVITGPTFDTGIVSGTWINLPTTMTASCSADATVCTYTIGSNPAVALNGTVLFSNENGSLIINASDAVGNTAASTPFDLKVDTTSPTGTFKVNGASVASSVDVNTTSPTLEITLSDGANGSGINSPTFVLKLNGTAVANQPALNAGVATYTAALSDGQTAVFTVEVSDKAGNPAGTLSQTIRVDVTPPTTITASAPTATKTPTPTFSSISATVTGFGTLGSGAKVVFQCTSGGTPVEIDYATSISSFNITQNGCPSTDGSRTVNIKVRDSLGNLSTESKDVTINYDTTAPATIDGGSITSSNVDNDSATLDWPDGSDGSNGSGIDEYKVYRSTSNNSSGASHIGTPSSSTFNDSGLSACTDYYYWVKAVDNVGNEGGFGSSLNVKTTNCPDNSPPNNDDDDSPSPGPSPGPSNSTCNVTVTVPASVYAGETITLSASGSGYAGGRIVAYETGKVGTEIGKSTTTKTEWSGTYTIPNSIGKKLNVRFKTEACNTLAVERVIKDPSTRPAPTAPTVAPAAGATTPNTLAAPQALPEPGVLSFVLENITSMMTNAGFNAENAQMKADVENALTEWNVSPTVKMVPVAGEDGKYALQLIYSLVNAGNKGSIKMVVDVPKTFASTASAMDASSPMTVLKEDPLVQFELSDLFEGQPIDIVLTTKNTFTFGVASSKMEAVQALTLNPPLIFSSGVGKAVERKEAPTDNSALITGLVGFAGNTAPFVLGFLLIVGLIFVSVRVVRGSVAGADNPILRSSSGIKNNGPGFRTPNVPVRGRKTWKSGEVRLNDDY